MKSTCVCACVCWGKLRFYMGCLMKKVISEESSGEVEGEEYSQGEGTARAKARVHSVPGFFLGWWGDPPGRVAETKGAKKKMGTETWALIYVAHFPLLDFHVISSFPTWWITCCGFHLLSVMLWGRKADGKKWVVGVSPFLHVGWNFESLPLTFIHFGFVKARCRWPLGLGMAAFLTLSKINGMIQYLIDL